MTGGIVEIDLHGKNAYQARVTIDAALRRARAGTYRLRIIHGYQGGTVLRDMVRQEYAGRVLRVVPLAARAKIAGRGMPLKVLFLQVV